MRFHLSIEQAPCGISDANYCLLKLLWFMHVLKISNAKKYYTRSQTSGSIF